MLPSTPRQEFKPACDKDLFLSLPSRPGVSNYLKWTDPGAQPYLARTADIRRAAERLLPNLIHFRSA